MTTSAVPGRRAAGRFRVDQDVLEWIAAQVDEFVAHLQAHHAADPRAQALFDKLRDVRLLPAAEAVPDNGAWKNGKFKHSTGVLFVAPREQDGRFRTESSLRRTVVHELAHATRHKEPGEASHSPQWKQTWLWFLEIATAELGWGVDIQCSECTFYGLCHPEQCPKCTWLQRLCRPYVGRPV